MVHITVDYDGKKVHEKTYENHAFATFKDVLRYVTNSLHWDRNRFDKSDLAIFQEPGFANENLTIFWKAAEDGEYKVRYDNKDCVIKIKDNPKLL